MRKITLMGFFLFILLTVTKISAQSIDYSVHASIIFRFTKYVEWPQEKKYDNFVIGVVGDSPLIDILTKTTRNKTVGIQKIEVKQFSVTAASFPCQILLICEDESSRLKKIAAITNELPVLIVTEDQGLCLKGSCVNFILEDDHLKLEFNKTNILNHHLNIASDLLSLGVIIENQK